jgi:hypothetical protein
MTTRVLSQPIDRHRNAATKEPVAKQWFSLFNELRTHHSIENEQIYNMDEKDFILGIMQCLMVLIPIDQKQAFIHEDSNREWISIIKCVNAGSNSRPLTSFIIFKGKIQQSTWFDNLTDKNAKIATSEKGWTDKEIGLDCLVVTVCSPTCKTLVSLECRVPLDTEHNQLISVPNIG